RSFHPRRRRSQGSRAHHRMPEVRGGAIQATEEAAYMGAVPMLTVQRLLNGSLDALREAIHDASAQEEPTRWVVSHIILGSALRLRAQRAMDEERARMYSEALHAFGTALTACCERRGAQFTSMSAVNGSNFSTSQTSCSGPDGVQLVMDGACVPIAAG